MKERKSKLRMLLLAKTKRICKKFFDYNIVFFLLLLYFFFFFLIWLSGLFVVVVLFWVGPMIHSEIEQTFEALHCLGSKTWWMVEWWGCGSQVEGRIYCIYTIFDEKTFQILFPLKFAKNFSMDSGSSFSLIDKRNGKKGRKMGLGAEWRWDRLGQIKY